MYTPGSKPVQVSSAMFTDTTGIQQQLKATHAEIMGYVDRGMPCLPAPNGRGLRFNLVECEAWLANHFAVAAAVAERLGWNLAQSKEWADAHDLAFSIDGGGNVVLDEDSFGAAVRRDQAEYAAEALAFSAAGSTEPDEHLELAA